MGEGSVDGLKDVDDKRERCFDNQVLKHRMVTLERTVLMRKQAKKSGIADSKSGSRQHGSGCSEDCRQQPTLHISLYDWVLLKNKKVLKNS